MTLLSSSVMVDRVGVGGDSRRMRRGREGAAKQSRRAGRVTDETMKRITCGLPTTHKLDRQMPSKLGFY